MERERNMEKKRERHGLFPQAQLPGDESKNYC